MINGVPTSYLGCDIIIPGTRGNYQTGDVSVQPSRQSRDSKYLGKKFTLVNVQISSANTTSLDFDLSKSYHKSAKISSIRATTMVTDNSVSKIRNSGGAYQDIIVAKSGHRNLDDFEFLWLRVSACRKTWCLALRGNDCIRNKARVHILESFHGLGNGRHFCECAMSISSERFSL